MQTVWTKVLFSVDISLCVSPCCEKFLVTLCQLKLIRKRPVIDFNVMSNWSIELL